MLLNNNNTSIRSDSKFPLLISSGSRQNYSMGTDEGAFALRTMGDVRSLIDCSLACGDGVSHAGMHLEEDDERKNTKKYNVMSAAERVLARASDRVLGVVVVSNTQSKRKQRSWDVRACVMGTEKLSSKHVNNDEDDDSLPSPKDQVSLVDWLSKPQPEKTRQTEKIFNESVITEPIDTAKIIPEKKANVDKLLGKPNPSRNKTEDLLAKNKNREKEANEDDDDDLEDGFIAL